MSFERPRFSVLLSTVLLAFAFPVFATAATSEYSVLFDVDASAATGCSVAGMNGVDHVLTTSISTDAQGGIVTAVRRQQCSGGVLLPAIDVEPGGWDVGFRSNGEATIETRIPFSVFPGGTMPTNMRLGFVGQTGTLVHTGLEAPNGDPILFPEMPLPRRRSINQGPRRDIILDGEIADWGTIKPFDVGLGSGGSSLLRIMKIHGYGDASYFYFRFDVRLNSSLPFAADDPTSGEYVVERGGTLTVPAPGVLENDESILAAMQAVRVTTPDDPTPKHGTVDLHPDGGFTYQNDGTGSHDRFYYKATDGTTETNVATVRIAITDAVNQPPNATDAIFSVSENSPSGTVVGTVSASDPDAGQTLTYAITGGNESGAFAINAATGQITVANGSAIDYESSPFFNLTVTVTDSGSPAQSDNAAIGVSITDVNEEPVLANQAFSVAENSPNGTVVGTVQAFDPDAGQTLTFAITGGNSGGAFAINANTGQLTVANSAALDRETTPSINVVVTVTDSGGTALTATATMTVTITNVNEAPVFSAPPPGPYSVDENSANGTSVVDLNATDPEGTALTWSITAGNVGNAFAVNSAGLITVAGPIDFETLSSYTLTVQVSDGVFSVTTTVTINVDNINEAPVNSVPGTQTATEDTPLVINGISVSDVEATSLEVTLTGNNGTVTLSGTTGLAFTVGDGTADPAMTFSGSTAAINAALAGLTFSPAANFNGNASLTITTNDLGATGAGGAQSDTDVVNVTVGAVNDAPVVTVPGAQVTNEDAALVIAGISIADIDAGSGSMQLTLTATNGSVTLASTAGLSFTTGDGTADATIVANGSLAAINAAINGLTFLPSTNISGAGSLSVAIADNGNTGTGGSLADTESIAITINPVNDAPVNTVPATQTTNEDTQLSIAGVSIADVDAAAGSVQVTLTATNGTMTLADTTGLSFSVGDGTADSTMTFSATLAVVNLRLATLSFSPAADFAGTASIQITTDDQGNTPAPPQTDTDSFNITVNAVNDAPVNTVPAAQSTNEDTPITFAGTLSTSDVDAATVQVTLVVNNGTLTLSGTAGLSFGTGDGTSDASMVFSGSVSAVNAALNGLQYLPALNYFGSDTLTITTNDLGNTGSGGAQSDTDTVSITVVSQNDAPILAGSPGIVGYTEGGAAVTLAPALTISDVDSTMLSGASVIISGNADLGQDDLSWTLPPGITATDLVAASGVVNFSGSATVADYQTLLRSVAFFSNSDAPLPAPRGIDIQVTDDLGATSNQLFVQVNVTTVNDGPTNTVPGPLSATEDVALPFGGSVSIADADAAAAGVQVTLSVNNGTLTFGSTAGLSFSTGDGTSDATMTFTGTIAAINSALGNISYLGNLNYNGSDTLTVTTNDLGNSGTGGALSDTDTVSISVSAVNDAPANTVPAPQAINEDATITFSTGNGNAISVADVDAGANNVQVTLTASSGVLTLNGTAGLSFGTGDGSADTTMTFTGTIAAINTALNGLLYAPGANAFGALTVTIATNDQGNTGSGGAQTDTDVVTVNVASINDAPVNTVPAPQTTGEDVPLSMVLSTTDIEATTLQVTLTATNGTVTLNGTAGLSFGAGDGTADATMTFTGPTASVNAAMNGLSFTPTLNYSGSASLQIVTSDLGVAGSGGTLTDSDTVSITVTAVNDAPVNTLPAAQSTNEDTPITLSGANAISIADIDAGASSVEVTLTIANGTVTLDGTTGLSFTTGDGTADASMVFTGSIAAINAALDGLIFTPSPNYFGAGTIQIVTSDQGNTGSGGAQSDTDTLTITVVNVNDAPSITPSSLTTLTYTENGPAATVDATVDIADSDNPNMASASVQITTNYQNGADILAVPCIACTGSGAMTANFVAGTGTLTITGAGTQAEYENTLRSVTYVNTSDNPSTLTRTVIWSINDGVDTGTGSSNIDVIAVNDAPANTMPAAQSVNEDTPLAITGLSISDVDAGTNDVKVSLTATNGALTLASLSGLTFSVGDGTSDASMTFTGTIADINAALNGMSFLSPLEYAGPASVQIVTDDQGFTGTGGALTDTDTLGITVNPVNDPPANTVPGAQNGTEDVAFVFSSGNGNQISISDGDAAANPVQVQLTATNGAITLNGTVGLSFTVGDGTSDATMTFTGTITAINTALNGLSFQPTLNYNGSATLQIVTNDQGFTGGGAQSDSDSVTINFSAVNDAPVNTVPGAQTVPEDATLTFTGGTLISVADVDAASLQITYSSTNGTLTLSGTTGLSFSVGDGTADATMTFTGTVAAVNAALAGSTYQPTAEYSGPAQVTILSEDLGSAGSGGALTDSDSVSITVTPTNDPPVNTVPGAQTVDEDQTLSLAFAVADPDAGTNAIQVTLTSTNGVLTLGGTTGLSFSVGDGTSDATMTFTGTITNLNAALAAVAYVPTLNYNGSATITMVTDDLGFTGGGAMTDTDIVSVTINAVNDAPVNTTPGPQTFDEDTNRVFNTANGNLISVADVDAGAAGVQVTLVATNGTLSTNGVAGVTFTTGDGTDDATLVFSGTVANVNARLNGLTYKPTLNYFGSATIDLTTSDLGNTGSGGTLTDGPDTISLTINPVNDAPTATAKTHATHSALGLTINAAAHTGELKEAGNETDVDDAFSELTVELVGTPIPADMTVTLISAADGSFYVEPPGGYTGAATFQYRVCDDNVGDPNRCSTPATVTVNVGGQQTWFVDDTDAAACGAGCNGSRTRPLVGLNTADPDFVARGTGDRIFVFSGTYNHGLTMAANERLVGQGSSSIIGGLGLDFSPFTNGTLDTLPSTGAAPTLQNTVTASNNSLVRGIAISAGANKGYLSAAGNTTLTVLESTVTSSNMAIDVAGATNAATSVAFTSTTSSGGTRGVSLDGVNGTWSLGSGSLTGSTQAGFYLQNSNASTITYSGTITPTGTGRAVLIGTADGNAGVNASNGMESGTTVTLSGNLTAGGIGMYESSGGTLNIGGATVTFNTGGVDALELIDNNNATVNFSGGNLALTTANGDGLSASQGGTVNITGDANTITTTGSGRAVDFIGTASEKMNGTLRFRSINKSGSGAKGIVVNHTNGSFTVTGDGADGDTLPDTLTSGGTITGTSDRGAELIEVAGGIGLNGMTFTNAVSVNGDTAANCGASIATGTNANCNAAIHMNTVSTGATLRKISVNGSAQMGINGLNVQNFAGDQIEVQNAGNEANEHGIQFKDLRGTSTLTASNIHNNASRQIYVVQTNGAAAGTVNLTITGTTFANSTNAATWNPGVSLDAYNSGTDFRVQFGDDTAGGANIVTNHGSNGLQTAVGTGATSGARMDINIWRNTFTNTNSAIVLQGAGSGLSTHNYSVRNNTITAGANSTSGAIIADSNQFAVLDGEIISNTIGTSGVAHSGAGLGSNGITISNDGNHTADIIGNVIRRVDTSGIYVLARALNTRVVITGNLIEEPDSAPNPSFSGIYVQGGISAASTQCVVATIGGSVTPGGYPSTTPNAKNRINGSWDPVGFQSEIFLWNKGGASSAFRMPGYVAPVATFVGNNNDIPDATGADVSSSGTFTAGTTCP